MCERSTERRGTDSQRKQLRRNGNDALESLVDSLAVILVSETLEIWSTWRFWGVTMETYVCKKCGAELILDDIKNWSKRACPECDEPIPQEEVVRAMKC